MDDVQEFYDVNTAAFLRFGAGAREGVMHREVWGPGVIRRQQAVRYVDNLLSQIVEQLQPQRVLDLGCGVGATMDYLYSIIPARYYGLTISPVQAELARERFMRSNRHEHCRVFAADFHDARAFRAFPDQDVAYAVESLVHARDVDAVLRNAGSVVRAGGALVVVDDFLTAKGAEMVAATAAGGGTAVPVDTPPDRRDAPVDPATAVRALLDRFHAGWLAPGLQTVPALCETAARHGFSPGEEQDLTPYLRLRRPRDRVLHWYLRLSARGAGGMRRRSLDGGDALQQLITDGIVEYRLVRFTRRQ